MSRKRVTQLFPRLLPLRIWQRKLCFYAGMRLDRRHYAGSISVPRLPYKVYSSKFSLYNRETGFDMVYQHNKVYNIKLAAKTLNGLLIKPGETFSFWKAVRHADRCSAYKDGLIMVNGRLTTERGGGLCLLSNLLFWVFLHTNLTIVERHTHMVKDFPTPPNTGPDGVDATVREGWLDLKARNDTNAALQLYIEFEDNYIIGGINSDKPAEHRYEVKSDNCRYFRKDGKIYESVTVFRNLIFLYENICEISYPLPNTAKIDERGN